MSKKPFVLTKHCLIAKNSFMALSNHDEIWMFLQENCPNRWIRIKDLIKYASYYNVDGKICTCMSVPTDVIPVRVKTVTSETLCNISVDVKGMFTILAHELSSQCSSNFNIKKKFENEELKISAFVEPQKPYRNPNINTDLFIIRFCKLMYRETDGNG